ncbi:hypothetical protein [Cryobacterium cryoconiti]|nr:hypothetical protein [Cryobacterium cryoconiti]
MTSTETDPAGGGNGAHDHRDDTEPSTDIDADVPDGTAAHA